MGSPQRDQENDQLPPWGNAPSPDSERLEMARRIALESLEEDHHALELDAKLAFGTSVAVGR